MKVWVLGCLAAASLVAAPMADAKVTARGSVGQAYVTGAKPRAAVTLMSRSGATLRRARTDRFGSRIFRNLEAGTYRVGTGGRSLRLRVLRGSDKPPRSLYTSQKLEQGLNYVRMRDGVELAMTVRLPPGKKLSDGPFPTLIEHSGYATAPPNDLLQSLVASVQGKTAKADPLAPASSTVVGSVIGPLLDFAVVSVQMRGSGCSGGAFDLFDLPTTYDGYDMVEAVAAQDWVKGSKVGMVGISFSGITQLFAAGTRPPSLAAIAPMSVTDDLYAATGYPGGIRNSGFARSWVNDRQDDARPAPQGGQQWARILTRRGDEHCIANQKLRLQTEDAAAIMERNPYRVRSIHDQRSGSTWMDTIEVPTFFVGQLQDEQTGGHFAESLDLLRRNPKVWITLQNGVHVDSLGPNTTTRWVEFLKLYVADEIPKLPDTVLQLSGALYEFLAEAGAAPVEQSRFASMTDVAAARRMFEQDPRVRLLMENGAGPAGPGALGAAFELGYDAWPIRQARATPFYLGTGGVMTPQASGAGTVEYVGDPKARPKQTLPGNGEADAWKAQPPYRWAPVAAGKGLGFATGPLEQDTVVAGPSSLDLDLESTARDTDLQVTLSEIRPDGNETYVQSGWLRASHRKLDRARSSATKAVPTHRERDAQPLPRDRAVPVRVPLFPVAHAFRKGSRIRVTVTAPGGDRPRWDFSTVERGRTRNTVVLGRSRLMLPVIQGATANGTPLPAPTALRGQPSRRYVAASNGG